MRMLQKTLVTRLPHYVGENDIYYNVHRLLLMYAFDAQVSRTTNLIPFSAIRSGHPASPITLDNPTSLASDPECTTCSHGIEINTFKMSDYFAGRHVEANAVVTATQKRLS